MHERGSKADLKQLAEYRKQWEGRRNRAQHHQEVPKSVSVPKVGHTYVDHLTGDKVKIVAVSIHEHIGDWVYTVKGADGLCWSFGPSQWIKRVLSCITNGPETRFQKA